MKAGKWMAALACAVLFLVYFTFRQRYIWGSDSFGYDRMATLFTAGRITLPTEFPATDYPALVPLGFSLKAGLVVPNYTPGYPVFLALGHLLHVPGLVTPLLTVASCVFLYLLLVDRVSRPTALAFAVAWAFMPTTVYGAVMMMSDGASATVLLAVLLAYRRNQWAATGWLLGLAVAIRPTNALFVLPFLLCVRWDRNLFRVAAHGACAGLIYAAYNWKLFGAPWRTGYGDIAVDLHAAVFPQHFQFYITQTLLVLSPVILGLAVISLVGASSGQGDPGSEFGDRRSGTRERIAYALWPLILIVFYSFWVPGGADRWWWTRFLLSGFGLLFLLAAEGFESWRARSGRRARAAGWVLMALLPLYYVGFGVRQRDLWLQDTGVVHHNVIGKVAAIAPPGSLVGTTEHGGTMLLYTQLVPYVSVHDEAPKLISMALAKGRRVFLLVEPWNADNDVIRRTIQEFHGRVIARFPELWDLPLYELAKE